MSHYAAYIAERTGDSIIETPFGFATYRYLKDRNAVYIVDIFVVKKSRKSGCAALLADKIADKAKEKGCVEMLGSVCPQAKGATTSLKVLLGYGMELLSATPELILFRKDL